MNGIQHPFRQFLEKKRENFFCFFTVKMHSVRLMANKYELEPTALNFEILTSIPKTCEGE